MYGQFMQMSRPQDWGKPHVETGRGLDCTQGRRYVRSEALEFMFMTTVHAVLGLRRNCCCRRGSQSPTLSERIHEGPHAHGSFD